MLRPGAVILGGPAPHVVPILLSAGHCVAEGLRSPPDVRIVAHGLALRMLSCLSANRRGGLLLSGCAAPGPRLDGSSCPTQHITFFLRSTECCVGRGPCSPLDDRGGVRSAEGVAMDWGLTALAAQCKTGSSLLLGIRCRVGGGSCLTLTVQGVEPCVVVVFVDLTALARRCKISFSLLPGTQCLVGEEACLTPGVRGGGPGGTEGGEGLPVRTVAGAVMLSKTAFLCAA